MASLKSFFSDLNASLTIDLNDPKLFKISGIISMVRKCISMAEQSFESGSPEDIHTDLHTVSMALHFLHKLLPTFEEAYSTLFVDLLDSEDRNDVLTKCKELEEDEKGGTFVKMKNIIENVPLADPEQVAALYKERLVHYKGNHVYGSQSIETSGKKIDLSIVKLIDYLFEKNHPREYEKFSMDDENNALIQLSETVDPVIENESCRFRHRDGSIEYFKRAQVVSVRISYMVDGNEYIFFFTCKTSLTKKDDYSFSYAMWFVPHDNADLMIYMPTKSTFNFAENRHADGVYLLLEYCNSKLIEDYGYTIDLLMEGEVNYQLDYEDEQGAYISLKS